MPYRTGLFDIHLWPFAFPRSSSSNVTDRSVPSRPTPPLGRVNLFTPKSDLLQISPAASPEILHSHSMKNLPFHSLLRWKMIILPILTTSLIHFTLKGWENVPFEHGSDEVNHVTILCVPEHSSCEPVPCQNGGTCTVVAHGYECTCSPGYMGLHCESELTGALWGEVNAPYYHGVPVAFNV